MSVIINFLFYIQIYILRVGHNFKNLMEDFWGFVDSHPLVGVLWISICLNLILITLCIGLVQGYEKDLKRYKKSVSDNKRKNQKLRSAMGQLQRELEEEDGEAWVDEDGNINIMNERKLENEVI